jgi:hypothetical protein
VRIQSVVKFVNLCIFTIEEARLPTVEEIMEKNQCCRSNAYNYLRALKHLYPEEMLERLARARRERERRTFQQTLQ